MCITLHQLNTLKKKSLIHVKHLSYWFYCGVTVFFVWVLGFLSVPVDLLWQTLCLCWNGPPCHSESILGNQPRTILVSLWYPSFMQKCSTSRLPLASETWTDRALVVLHVSSQSFRHCWLYNYGMWWWLLKAAVAVSKYNNAYSHRHAFIASNFYVKVSIIFTISPLFFPKPTPLNVLRGIKGQDSRHFLFFVNILLLIDRNTVIIRGWYCLITKTWWIRNNSASLWVCWLIQMSQQTR